MYTSSALVQDTSSIMLLEDIDLDNLKVSNLDNSANTDRVLTVNDLSLLSIIDSYNTNTLNNIFSIEDKDNNTYLVDTNNKILYFYKYIPLDKHTTGSGLKEPRRTFTLSEFKEMFQ